MIEEANNKKTLDCFESMIAEKMKEIEMYESSIRIQNNNDNEMKKIAVNISNLKNAINNILNRNKCTEALLIF